MVPGTKKVLKKWVAAILEPVEESLAEENGDVLKENEENPSDAKDLSAIVVPKLPFSYGMTYLPIWKSFKEHILDQKGFFFGLFVEFYVFIHFFKYEH